MGDEGERAWLENELRLERERSDTFHYPKGVGTSGPPTECQVCGLPWPCPTVEEQRDRKDDTRPRPLAARGGGAA